MNLKEKILNELKKDKKVENIYFDSPNLIKLDKIYNFPHVDQFHNYDCGAAAFLAILVFYGKDIRADKLLKLLKTNPKDGTTIENIIKISKKFKLDFEIKEKMNIDELKEFLKKNGNVCLIPIQAYKQDKKSYEDKKNDGHWVVVIGYEKGKFIIEDPSQHSKGYLSEKDLEERWYDYDKKKKVDHFGICYSGKRKFSLSILNKID